jgi:hypothetical protein
LIFNLFGLFFALNYFDNLNSGGVRSTRNLELGMIGFFANGIIFITLYSFTITDILLFTIGNLFFYWSQCEISYLASKTEIKGMLMHLSIVIIVISIIQLYFIRPIEYLFLFFIVVILLYQDRYRNSDQLPPLLNLPDIIKLKKTKSNSLFVASFIWVVFLHSIHILLIESNYSFIYILLFALIHSLMLCVCDTNNLNIIQIEVGFFPRTFGEKFFSKTYLGKYLVKLFLQIRIIYYQFFFLFYCYRLVHQFGVYYK